jgi:hypothetical protein
MRSADIAEDHAIIDGKRSGGRGKITRGDVRGLIVDPPAARFQRRTQPPDALHIFRRGETVEALLMNAMRRPGFTRDQDSLRLRHFSMLHSVGEGRCIGEIGEERVPTPARQQYLGRHAAQTKLMQTRPTRLDRLAGNGALQEPTGPKGSSSPLRLDGGGAP